MVQHLSELVEIEISECRIMNYIIAKQRQEDEGETDIIALPKLRSLTLESLPSLVSLSPESCIKDSENNNDFSSQLLSDKVQTRILTLYYDLYYAQTDHTTDILTPIRI
jgi:hypothetical protein